jgi:hypothetical protein
MTMKQHFTMSQVCDLKQLMTASERYAHELDWGAARGQRTRLILQSHAINATRYFVMEALLEAARHGVSSVFFAPTPALADLQREIAVRVAAKLGVRLTGGSLKIHSDCIDGDARIRFFGKKYGHAEGLNGNVYVDQFCWMPEFGRVKKVASGISLQRQYRRTYFSAAPDFDRGSERCDPAAWSWANAHSFDDVFSACPDGVWRHRVDINAAIAGGCNLFDLDELRAEYSPAEFANMFLCQAVFPAKSA